MGLRTDLEYDIPRPNAFQRAVWKVSSSRPGAWFFAKTAHHLDRALVRVSGGRFTVARVVAGLPTVMVTATGAKSGRSRTLPLLGVPFGDDGIAVIGTNFGQTHTPGWAYNLVANPAATVSHSGRSVDVVARQLDGDELEMAWAAGRQAYAGYEAYARRITDRTVRVFSLDPVG